MPAADLCYTFYNGSRYLCIILYLLYYTRIIYIIHHSRRHRHTVSLSNNDNDILPRSCFIYYFIVYTFLIIIYRGDIPIIQCNDAWYSFQTYFFTSFICVCECVCALILKLSRYAGAVLYYLYLTFFSFVLIETEQQKMFALIKWNYRKKIIWFVLSLRWTV